MRDSEDGSAVRWPLSRFLITGGLLAGAGYLPLQLYILFGPRDGNPIGLGLLFVIGLCAGLVTIAVGLIRVALRSFSSRKAEQ